MTSRGPQEGDIMNFLEGDSEVKLHLPRLSISGWKSNGKPTKIQHHPHNHQNQASISKSSRFRIILKIHSASAYPSKSPQSSTILKTIKWKHHLQKHQNPASKFQIDTRKSSGYARFMAWWFLGSTCESPGNLLKLPPSRKAKMMVFF